MAHLKIHEGMYRKVVRPEALIICILCYGGMFVLMPIEDEAWTNRKPQALISCL